MSRFNDLEKQLADLQTREHALKQLVASAGWKEVVSLCEGAITTRRQGVFSKLTMIRSESDLFEIAGLGSEVAGIEFAKNIPYILLRDLAVDIERTIIARRETEDE